jgi:hypothetical protein
VQLRRVTDIGAVSRHAEERPCNGHLTRREQPEDVIATDHRPIVDASSRSSHRSGGSRAPLACAVESEDDVKCL